jgi:hypothetical protein
MVKKVMFLASFALLVGIGFSWNSGFLNKLFKPEIKTTVTAEFKEYKQIEKLITSFVYVPLLDYETGKTKRQFLSLGFWGGDKEKVKGICYRQYSATIGYVNPSEKFDQYLETACKNNDSALPEPQIVALNAESSEVIGKYIQTDCDNFDLGDYGDRPSEEYVIQKLNQQNHWNGIVKSSQKVLGSFIRVYCQN